MSYGDLACKREEVYEIVETIVDVESWYLEWKRIAERAEQEKRYLHAVFYYRMAEFLLDDFRLEKNKMYYKMTEMFELYAPDLVKDRVPFKDAFLPSISIGDTNSPKTLLVHGGYDSFIEEFYPLIKNFADEGYRVLLFEGAGQGETLRHNLKFEARWEESISAILDYYEIEEAALIGISWGGFLALKASAIEKRITHVVSFGGFFDGLDVQFSFLDNPLKAVFAQMYKMNFAKVINFLVKKKMSRDNLANWAISHGMYITGTKSPFKFYQAIEKHSLLGVHNLVDQKVLLLAGEEDHYIPHWQHNYLKKQLNNAQVDSRIFTKKENGEQHCQVGNYDLALNYILEWLKLNY